MRHGASRIATVIGVIVGIIVCVAVISHGLAGQDTSPATTKSASSSDLVVESWQFVPGAYTSTVEGVAKNTGSSTLSYAEVDFNIFDKDGNQIGTAMANTNDLAGNGQTWKFSAAVLEDGAVSAKYTGVTTY